MPVEAMALGTPALVQQQGGARESVQAVTGGAVIESISVQDLKSGIEAALAIDTSGLPQRTLDRFDESVFTMQMRDWVTGTL